MGRLSGSVLVWAGSVGLLFWAALDNAPSPADFCYCDVGSAPRTRDAVCLACFSISTWHSAV